MAAKKESEREKFFPVKRKHEHWMSLKFHTVHYKFMKISLIRRIESTLLIYLVDLHIQE